MKNKIIAILIAILMVMSLFPMNTLAADPPINTNGSYDIGDYGNDSIITINSGLAVTLTNSSNITYTNMSIVCGAGVSLTINDIKITNSSSYLCPIAFTGSGNQLILEGNSELKSDDYEPGIRVEDSAELEISGTGSVTARGSGGGAGIGGGDNSTGGSITITSGTVTAYAGADSAGIGGGCFGSGGTITISGGTVTANGPSSVGCGIGGGAGGGSGEINITGGTVNATAGQDGAGIGGFGERTGDSITISGGEVTATGGIYGAGIGGGIEANGGVINISGGEIVATGGERAAGIGGGNNADGDSDGGIGGEINISNGTITAYGGKQAAGIGGGSVGDSGTININGGDVWAVAGIGAAGIGSGYLRNGQSITITDGYVYAKGGDTDTLNGGGAGIGGPSSSLGVYSTAGTISIEGGIVCAEKGDSALHDIGNGWNGRYGSLSISGDAAVLLANNACLTPTTTTHELVSTNSVINNKIFGQINVSLLGWTVPYYAYLNSSKISTLTYHSNGGIGTVPDAVTQFNNTTVFIANGSELTKNSKGYDHWNTSSTDTGTTYMPSNEYTFTQDDTLYAIYGTVPAASSVSLDKSTSNITVGDTDTLTATVAPADAANKNVTWSSDDESIATVADGVVTGVSQGTATITVTTEVGGFTDTCDVTVESAALFDGTGTEQDPYLIQSAGDLETLATLINEGDSPYADAYYLQTTDIDLSADTNWTPIGKYSSDTYIFEGSYDGGNYSISNLSIIGKSDTHSDTNSLGSIGLFGYARGEIKNLNIDGGIIRVYPDVGVYAGGIVGQLEGGTVQNCSSSAIIEIVVEVGTSVLPYYAYVGGVIGGTHDYNVIENCSYSGSLSVVNGNDDESYVGGIVGLVNQDGGSSTIRNCYNTGLIYGEGVEMGAGGIIGYTSGFWSSSEIEKCFNAGDVTSNLIDSYFSGQITCGGIVASSEKVNITDCFNLGKIAASVDFETIFCGQGGIAGYFGTGTIENCYNAGRLYGDNRGGIGGYLSDNTTLIGCYYADTCEQTDRDGNFSANKCTLEQMKQEFTFAEFDFINTWEIVEGEYYPVLQGLPFTYTTGLSISQSTEELSVSETVQLTATVSPANATNKNVTWSSDVESIATVADGVVTGVSQGTATITVTTEDGSFTDTCDVTVNQPVTGVSLNKATTTVSVGSMDTLTATVSPANATNKNVTWSSDVESIATVADGVVTGISQGTATITVATEDGSFTDTCDLTVKPAMPFAGVGTELDPYLIQSAEDLAMVSTLVSGGNTFADEYFLQTENIDLSGYANWTPIGTGSHISLAFRGTYDGNNKDIVGLNIDYASTGTAYIGLFGTIRGKIKNVKLLSGNISIVNDGYIIAGGIVGNLYEGSVENCYNSVNISAIRNSGNQSRTSTGGIVGEAGINADAISGCVNTGDVQGSGYEGFVGGIVGYNDGGLQISNCINHGNILGENSAGGISGFSSDFSAIYPTIRQCYNTGSVCVDNETHYGYAGGIAGSAFSTIITDCFNLGRISEKNDVYTANLGGIIGRGEETAWYYISDCYNIGIINGDGAYGGIAGTVDANSIANCYYADTCSVDIGSGIGITYQKTLEQMKQQATYVGFDFTNTWEIVEGVRFPVLQEVLFTYVTDISISETLSIEVGESETLLSAITPSDASNKNIYWSSSDESIATIEDGLVTAVGLGTATITVTTEDGGFTDTCEVTVIQPVTGVTLDNDLLDMLLGESETLAATVSPGDATNQNVSWASSNSGVATVSNGVISAVGAGLATITVTTEDGGFTDTCEVTVIQPVTGVTLDHDTLDMLIGESDTLTETVSPADATNQNVSWMTSNNSVATVSDGTVTAISAGTATITVTTEDGGFIDTCTITVESGQVESSIYTIDRVNGLLLDVAIDTSVTELKNNLTNDAADIKVFGKDGVEYTGNTLASGMVVQLIINDVVKDELTVSILGDVSGNGQIDIADYILIRSSLYGIINLNTLQFFGADINKNGNIDIADYILVRSHMYGLIQL